MIRQHHLARSLALTLAAGVACAYAASAIAAVTPPIVAEATLVIGVAHVAGSDGQRRAVDRGTAVRVGDRIETAAGGHVHLRFVDGARVSVRPSSRLAIEDYSHAEAGGAGAIKFRLEEGVVRSITGEWGESARERFRLNTPLAAIGIKGTDFVARAEDGRTAASVFTGAIVVTPLDSHCTTTVGPCLNGLEALLTHQQRGQALQVASTQARPVRVSVSETAPRAGQSVALVAARANIATDVDVTTAPDVEDGGKALANAQLAREGLVAAASVPPRVEQLAWGRWSWAKPIDSDVLATQIDAAFREGRQALVGNGAHTLYRPASGGAADARLVRQDTAVSFRLAGGAAHVVRQFAPPDPASVSGGQLAVDFARNTFTTRLHVTGPTIGEQQIDAAGTVLSNGVFLSTTGNAYVAGGLSTDGREAGYLFDKAVEAGQLRGITLWGP